MKHYTSLFRISIFLLTLIFCIVGSKSTLADPQPLPFDFSPGIGQLEWRDIQQEDGCTITNPQAPLHINDATDAMGNTDAYDRGLITLVGGTAVQSDGIGDLTNNVYTAATQNILGLDVTYQLFFSEDTQCVRLLLFLDNNTALPINEEVFFLTDFGSGSQTVFDGSSSGDNTFTTADRWIVTSSDSDTPRPVNTSVFYGPGQPESPTTSASLTGCALVTPGNTVTYDVMVPANSSRSLMLFACLGDITGEGNTVAAALSAADLFNSNQTIPGDLLSGLSQRQLKEILNWDFSSLSVPTLSEWGLIAMAALIGIIGFIVVRRRAVGSH